MQRYLFLRRHHLHRCVDYYLWLERIAKEVEDEQTKRTECQRRRFTA